MLNAYYLITIYITIVNGMVSPDANSHKLDYLFSKLLRYEHHAENYKLALQKQIIPFGLRIKKLPAIKPISEDFRNQWNSVLYGSEKRLVQLLLVETQNVVEKTQIEFNENMHEKYPESFREKKLLIEKRNGKIKKQLETKRVRKWIKFKSNKHIGRANIAKKCTHLTSPKRKEGNVPLKDIVFFNEDQSEETLPSKEKLKLVTDNRQQQKRNKTYADVVVNIEDNSVLGYNTKSNNDTTPNRSKKDLRSTVQKSAMSKEELKSVCNVLLSEDSLTAEPRPPVLTADTSIFDNSSAPSNTEEPRKEIQNYDNSVNDMDE